MPRGAFAVFADPEGAAPTPRERVSSKSSSSRRTAAPLSNKENAARAPSTGLGKKALVSGKKPSTSTADKPAKPAQAGNGVCTGTLRTRELPSHIWSPPRDAQPFLHDCHLVQLKEQAQVDERKNIKQKQLRKGEKSDCGANTRARELTESPLAEVTEAYTGQGAFRLANVSEDISSPTPASRTTPPFEGDEDIDEVLSLPVHHRHVKAVGRKMGSMRI